VLRGQDAHQIEELKCGLTGFDRKTVRKYLAQPEAVPSYGPRAAGTGKLAPFQPFLNEPLSAGVWNAQVLLSELRERGYHGGYTILTGWLRPQRQSARAIAVRRFETPAGKQAQVEWGHLGYIDTARLWGFTFTSGHCRAIMASAALDQKLGTLLRIHEEAFRQFGGVPEEILYDRMRTVWEPKPGLLGHLKK
jgi:transposase